MLLLAEAMQTAWSVCNSSVSLFSSRVKQNPFSFVFVFHLYGVIFFFYEKYPKPKNPNNNQNKKSRHRFDQGFFLEGFLAAFCCVQIHMPSRTGLICGTPGSSASQLHPQLTAWAHLLCKAQLKHLTHNSSRAGGTYQSGLAWKTPSEVLHDSYRAGDWVSSLPKQHCFPRGIQSSLSRAARFVLKAGWLSTRGAMLCVDFYQLQASHGLHINLQSTQLKGSALLVCLFKLWRENEITEQFTFY